MILSIRARSVWGVAICLLLASGAQAQQGRGILSPFGGTFTIHGPGPFIGVTVRDVESADGTASTGGALIIAISPNSPAASAGLQISDIVVEFDGERVRSARQLARLVQETAAHRQIQAAIVRSGQRQDVTLAPAGSGAIGLSRNRADVPGKSDRDAMQLQGAPRLGVTVQNMTRLLADHFNAEEGVLVSAVVDGSAAALAGLRVGDVILAVDGQRVRSQTDLTHVLGSATGSLALYVVRDKWPLTITVSLTGPARAPAGWVM
jgi:serine protease Do